MSPTPTIKLIVCLFILIGYVPEVLARELVVGFESPYTTISKAVEAASDGDKLVIKAGTYREPTIIINKSLEIIGEDGAVLDGEGKHEIMYVEAENFTARNLTFINAGVSYTKDNAALKLEGVKNCTIDGNTFKDNFFALYLSKSKDCVLSNNHIEGSKLSEASSGNGIHLWYTTDVTIKDNYISDHRDGIYFEFVKNALIHRNRTTKNLRYGLHFMFSDNCTYTDNEFVGNGAGVAVMYTVKVVMQRNLFMDNWGPASYGLLLKDIRESTVTENIFRKNSTALFIEGSSRNIIERNSFTGNGWAIELMGNAMDNVFAQNDFVANAFDVATNTSNSYNEFKENYWDNYRGYDLDRDGFGDVPFRPVRLFSYLVGKTPPLLVLLRSFFVDILDMTERVFPVLTPEMLIDSRPRMQSLK